MKPTNKTVVPFALGFIVSFIWTMIVAYYYKSKFEYMTVSSQEKSEALIFVK